MKVYDLIMVATHQNTNMIFQLINSIEKYNTNVNLLLLVVCQESKVIYSSSNSLFSLIFIEEKKMGLSKARNIALKHLHENNISSDYIMFPDDDSSFDDVFFRNFITMKSSGLNYLTPIYNTGTKDIYIGKKKNNSQVKVSDYNMVGSPNQIIQYEKFKEYIYFNEELGVGAKYGSSEDLDLFIRLNLSGAKFIYTDKLYTYHPKKTDIYKNKRLSDIVSRFKNYSGGFALIIFKYGLYGFIPAYMFRTFAASIIFALRLNFKLSLAYFLQFFIRIQLLFFFWLNKKQFNNE